VICNANSGKQHAIGYMQGDSYYGARATMNVWSPYIEVPSEFSLSQMWLLAGSFNSDLNSIEAGWQVCCLLTQFLVGPYPQALISLILHIYILVLILSCLEICKSQRSCRVITPMSTKNHEFPYFTSNYNIESLPTNHIGLRQI